MRWVLDTNVVSEIGRKNADRRVLTWFARQQRADIAISLVTLAELRSGAANAPTEEKRRDVIHWLESVIEPSFEDRVLPVTIEILTDWLNFGRKLAANRATRDVADALIASTARVHNLTVATRNVRHFAGAGVTVYNPWTDETHTTESL